MPPSSTTSSKNGLHSIQGLGKEVTYKPQTSQAFAKLSVALHNLWNGVIVEETAHTAHSFPGKFISEAKWDSALELRASLNRRPWTGCLGCVLNVPSALELEHSWEQGRKFWNCTVSGAFSFCLSPTLWEELVSMNWSPWRQEPYLD